ncbi:hypothetical protein [Carboxylicivirga sp. RSCT41]|uniref:hypothetical protein n=1 Tax=Carboxylicivirga agarovorans TaxID=3417570 RepID=UPI003D3489B4
MKKQLLNSLTLVALLCFTLFISSCDDDDNNDNPKPEDIETTLNKLKGIWLNTSATNFNAFAFMGDSKLLEYTDNGISYYSYEVIEADKIRVTRLWNVGDDKEETVHELTFHNNDNQLVIPGLIAVDHGITGFEDVNLMRIDPLQMLNNLHFPNPQLNEITDQWYLEAYITMDDLVLQLPSQASIGEPVTLELKSDGSCKVQTVNKLEGTFSLHNRLIDLELTGTEMNETDFTRPVSNSLANESLSVFVIGNDRLVLVGDSIAMLFKSSSKNKL